VFGRLRQKGGTARIADARTIKKSEWAKQSEWPDLLVEEACYQEISIDGQTIRVVRPTDAQLQGKNLPSVQQLAAALSVVPRHQRELTRTALIRANAKGGLRGLGGDGEIEIFPVDAGQGSNEEKVYRASPETYFDILITHECAHNYHGKFWSGAEDVADWQSYADADRSRPSPYAAESGGEDFCEFIVLYPCEKLLQSMYPNRWRRLQAYQAR